MSRNDLPGDPATVCSSSVRYDRVHDHHSSRFPGDDCRFAIRESLNLQGAIFESHLVKCYEYLHAFARALYVPVAVEGLLALCVERIARPQVLDEDVLIREEMLA
ncbi:MAG: hypothetical protein FJZ47_23740 [Candidatus Tectomicrobia bacterium]|uniref:Uncharacterized protein n=1 Tax=Tectimicrobiota bacterium TaxID=2528274 RepID=A0A937W4F9_UNCTE|nr:hypothetical protein [Candidatus Tectomicrobia bacterium]